MRYNAQQLAALPEAEFQKYYNSYVAYYKALAPEKRQPEQQYAAIMQAAYKARRQAATSFAALVEAAEPPEPIQMQPSTVCRQENSAPPFVEAEPLSPPQPQQPKNQKLLGCLIIVAIILVVILVLPFLFPAKKTPSDNSAPVRASSAVSNDAVASAQGVPLEDVVAKMKDALQSSFGENYKLEYDETGVTITIWSENINAGAALVISGDNDAAAAWDTVVQNQLAAYESMASMLKETGHDNVALMYLIANAENKDNCLLMIADGAIAYDVTKADAPQ